MSWECAWIDGGLVPLGEARVPVSDRGFLFADSVFETVRTYGRRPFLFGDHLDRLRRSAAALMLSLPWSDEQLTASLHQLLARVPDGEEANVRVIVTRGDGGKGLALPEPQCPRLVMLCRALPVFPDGLRQDGVAVALPERSSRKDVAVPAYVKSGSYLGNVLALAEARARGGFEGLLLAADGTLAEATTSNLFVVIADRLHTPDAEHVLPGITRAVVLHSARQLGLEVSEGPLPIGQLLAADEVFITSSLKEIVPVVSLEGRPVGCGVRGPWTRSLQRAWRGTVASVQALGLSRLSELPPS